METECEVDGTGSGSRPVAGFGNIGFSHQRVSNLKRREGAWTAVGLRALQRVLKVRNRLGTSDAEIRLRHSASSCWSWRQPQQLVNTSTWYSCRPAGRFLQQRRPLLPAARCGSHRRGSTADTPTAEVFFKLHSELCVENFK